MKASLLNVAMYRELVNSTNFALRMGKRNGITDPQLAIADTYSWNSDVEQVINILAPQIGWPTLAEMQEGKVMQRAPEPKVEWSEDEVTAIMELNFYSFYMHAYWFAKAMQTKFEDIAFDTPIGSYSQVFDIVNQYLGQDLAPSDYDGTNIRKNTDWYDKNADRQEFLQEVMPLIETRNPNLLVATHEALMEGHIELVENARQEQTAKLAKTASALFGADFEFQQAPKSALASKMPAFNPAIQ